MSENDLSISHPHIGVLYQLYASETQAFRKVHRMIDLFESIIKMHTVVILSEYVAHNNLSDVAKGLLAQGLRTPSLGTWQLFSRVLFTELQLSSYQWMLDELPMDFVLSDNELSSGLLKAKLEFPQFNKEVLIQLKADKKNRQSNFDDVIALRNSYAHGATPSDEKCAEDIQKFEPFLMQLLALNWLHHSYLEVEDNKVILNYKQQKLSLHPLLLYRNEQTEASFAFFNDLKNDKIGLLNYPLGKHYREKEFLNEFHQYIPINEWKKTGANEFQQRIEELTETFKGRTAERKQLLNFVVEKQKGYCSIQGNPGIGKSALIAQFFKDLRLHESCKDIQVIEYFIRRGTQQAKPEVLLEYLIKKTDELFPKAREIRAEGKMVFDLQNQLFAKWRLWAEHCKGTKILFLIDGLDEGVEENIIQYLPKENFQNILFIYGSRPGGHKSIDELWANLPIEHHLKIELSGLGKEDIRAMIYEVANKYEIEKDSAWIEAIQQRSQGNPLYLKLLCDALANKSIGLNDINALPKELDEYYKAILYRYAQDSVDGDALLDSLYTFAAAKDYLSFAHIGLINKLGEAKLQRIGSTLKEVLIENPLTENVLDYQLFHESFREYLFKEKSFKITEANEQIINYCGSWKKLEGTWEQRYALEFYAVHLIESQKAIHNETLLKLIEDKAYLSAQKKVLRHFKASNKLMQLAIEKSAELQNQDTLLEAALCLVDLKYEEENDAPRIIEMVANGEIDFALQRIEAFGTNDKEGLERKFILYMLCLMELTLLESKDKPFRKEAIEKLLKHLDENLPIDHSILNWNDFFSSYLIFQMACEWAELGLDYLTVYKRTDNWEKNWISEKGPYFQKQIDVLINSTNEISDDSTKNKALLAISSELAKQNKITESLNIARCIGDDWSKSDALIAIASEIAKNGKINESSNIITESLNIARDIKFDWLKSKALIAIASLQAMMGKLDDLSILLSESLSLAKEISDKKEKIEVFIAIASLEAMLGNLDDSSKLISESLSLADEISDDRQKIEILLAIANELNKQLKIQEASKLVFESLGIARKLGDEWNKYNSLSKISNEFSKQDKLDESLSIANEIIDEDIKLNTVKAIVTILTKQGKIEESLKIAKGLSSEFCKCDVYIAIASELTNQDKFEESFKILKDSIIIAQGIRAYYDKSSLLISIASILHKIGKADDSSKVIADSMDIALSISDVNIKCDALFEIKSELILQGRLKWLAYILQESLKIANGVSFKHQETSALKSIAAELALQGNIEESMSIIAYGISDNQIKITALTAIALELALKGKIKKSLFMARLISIELEKSLAFRKIASELVKHGKVNESKIFIEESLSIEETISKANELNNMHLKSKAFETIALELAKIGKIEDALQIANQVSLHKEREFLKVIVSELTLQGKFEESLIIAHSIKDDLYNAGIFNIIASEMAKQGMVEESLEIANEIGFISPGLAFIAISAELAKRGNFEDALLVARNAFWEVEKSSALIAIASELFRKEKFDESYKLISESLSIARDLINKSEKSDAFKTIALELSKQGNYKKVEEVVNEIPLLAERAQYFAMSVKSIIENQGWNTAVKQYHQFQSKEAQVFFLKAIVEHINIIDVTDDCIEVLIPMLSNDTYSIEILLQKYSIKKFIMKKVYTKEEERLNRTLNLQWVLDITAKFEKEFTRSSQNIQVWINEIEDENDREDILGWAEKVQQGKMTEEKFLERISKL